MISTLARRGQKFAQKSTNQILIRQKLGKKKGKKKKKTSEGEGGISVVSCSFFENSFGGWQNGWALVKQSHRFEQKRIFLGANGGWRAGEKVQGKRRSGFGKDR